MKKIICLLLTVAMLGTCMNVSAAEPQTYCTNYNEQYEAYINICKKMAVKPELVLEKNKYNEQDQRHIKVDWNDVSGATDYQLQVSADPAFRNCILDTQRLAIRGSYYNVLINENKEATYYVRVRPVFSYKYGENYIRVPGRWSNVVVAKGW